MVEAQNCVYYLQQFLNKARDPTDYQSLNTYLPQMFQMFAWAGSIAVEVVASEQYCALCRQPIPDPTSAPSLGCWKDHFACSWNCLASYVYQCVWDSKIDFNNISCPQCQTFIPPQLCEYVLTNCCGGLSSYQTVEYSQAAQQAETVAYEVPSLHSFKCEICTFDGNVEEETTLDCDHRFHKECLKDLFDNQLNDRKVADKDIACPTCHVHISPYILQNVHPARYQEYLTLAMQSAAQNFVEGGEKVS